MCDYIKKKKKEEQFTDRWDKKKNEGITGFTLKEQRIYLNRGETYTYEDRVYVRESYRWSMAS